jgi:predicted secreted protein
MKIDTDPNGISIRLIAEQWSTGDENVAVAEIVGRGRETQGQGRITIPIGVNAPAEHVNLQPGDYTVRIYLPSGDVLAESVTVGSESKSNDSNVEFDIQRSPHEWLSLGDAVGAVQRLPNAAHARSLESWRSGERLRAGVTANVARRVDQAIDDYNAGYESLQRLATGGIPSGTCGAATIDPDRAIPEGRLTTEQVVAWWMGTPAGDPLSLAVSHHDDRNAKLSSAAPGNLANKDLLTGEYRVFARIQDPRGRTHHAVYPLGWRGVSQSRPGDVVGAELLMTVVIDSVMRGSSDVAEAAQWRCVPTVMDVEAMAYLGFLHSSQASAAEAMLERAYELLYEKQVNPVAAAAGAFGLLAFRESSGRTQRNWRAWVRNLFSLYPHLPDAAIAMAQLYLRQGEGESASDDLDIERLRRFALEATRRGLPYLTYGIRLLSEIFVLLIADDQQHERSGPLVEQTVRARRMVRELERLLVPSAFFTVLETGGTA